jgi:O-methyltransferase
MHSVTNPVFAEKPETLYPELLKKTLSFSLWPEPPVRIDSFNYLRPAPVRAAISALSSVFDLAGIELVYHRKVDSASREEGRFWPGLADTMIGMKRLDNLHRCVEQVLEDNVPGDFIETGVWRGGSCIFMCAALAAYGVTDRRVFVADSFAGLPEPNAERYPADRGDQHHIHKSLVVTEEQVRQNFRKYGLLDEQVVFLKGWFSDTLPAAPIERLAIMRLDGDMYGSRMDAFNSLYERLSPGGFCIIDDYALDGCRMAVDDFRRERGIEAPLIEVDRTGRYWRKER